jgi:hypothetical protein
MEKIKNGVLGCLPYDYLATTNQVLHTESGIEPLNFEFIKIVFSSSHFWN